MGKRKKNEELDKALMLRVRRGSRRLLHGLVLLELVLIFVKQLVGIGFTSYRFML